MIDVPIIFAESLIALTKKSDIKWVLDQRDHITASVGKTKFDFDVRNSRFTIQVPVPSSVPTSWDKRYADGEVETVFQFNQNGTIWNLLQAAKEQLGYPSQNDIVLAALNTLSTLTPKSTPDKEL